MTKSVINSHCIELSFYEACRKGLSFGFDSYYSQSFMSYKMHPHSHPSIELLYVTKGELNVVLDLPEDRMQSGQSKRQRLTLRPDEFLFIDSTLRHALCVHEGAEKPVHILNAEFMPLSPTTDYRDFKDHNGRPLAVVSMNSLRDHSPQFSAFLGPARPFIHLKDQDKLLVSAMRLLVSALQDQERSYDDAWMVQAPLKILFRELGKRQPAQHLKGAKRHVEFANQYIESNFDRPITVQDVAEFVGIHPAYLQRIYHAEQGYTLMNYVNKLRMAKARHLVGVTALSIEEIAGQVGFKSRQSFSSAFNKYFAMNPQTFRRKSRSGQMDL